jgi:hypothetical protein
MSFGINNPANQLAASQYPAFVGPPASSTASGANDASGSDSIGSGSNSSNSVQLELQMLEQLLQEVAQQNGSAQADSGAQSPSNDGQGSDTAQGASAGQGHHHHHHHSAGVASGAAGGSAVQLPLSSDLSSSNAGTQTQNLDD